MQGFITESASKLSDGLGSAIKLVMIALLLWFLSNVVNLSVFKLDNFLLLVILVVANLLFFYRCMNPLKSQDQRAVDGMIAGLLFWHMMRSVSLEFSVNLAGPRELMYWFGSITLTGLLWKKTLSAGLRSALIIFLANWLGWICVQSFDLMVQLNPILKIIPFLASLGGIFSIWFITLRSANITQRHFGAEALYFCVMLTLMRF